MQLMPSVTKFSHALCLALIVTACASGTNQHQQRPPLSTEAVFEHVGGQWIERYLAADLDGLMELYTDDARVMLHGKPAMVGKPAIRNFFAASLGQAKVSFEIDVEKAEIYGDVAYLISKYWMSVDAEDGTPAFTDAGRSLLIYQRGVDGDWKIHADIDQATPDVGWPRPNN